MVHVNSETVTAHVRDAFLEFLSAEQREDGLHLTLPYALHDQTVLTFRIEEDGKTAWITDEGLVLNHLEMAGVDLTEERTWKTWEYLRNNAATMDSSAFSLGDRAAPWELAAHSTMENLGSSVMSLALAAMEVDGLVHLSRPRRETESFRDRAFRELRESLSKDVLILQKQPIPTKVSNLSEKVWAVLTRGEGMPNLYLEAIGKSGIRQSADHAVASFALSDTQKDERAAVLERTVDQSSRHVRRLAEVSRITTEDDSASLEGQLDRLAV